MQCADDIYKFFADYIFRFTGIFYSQDNYYQLESRLQELKTQFKFDTLEQVYDGYTKKLTPSMHQMLIDLATNNETSFFRDQYPFDALVQAKRSLLREKPFGITIWSAACSAGQEPYGMVMALNEDGDELQKGQITIYASDISTRILEKAKQAIYNQMEVQRGLPIKMLTKYFEKRPYSQWQFKSMFQKYVYFNEFNLLSGIYPIQKYDIVFCRNILIYQTIENKEKILNNIYRSIVPGGLLFLGSAENILNMNLPFIQESQGNCTIFRKPFKK